MSNLENVHHRKSVLDSDIQDREREYEKRSSGSKHSGALNIFHESKKFEGVFRKSSPKESFGSIGKGKRRNKSQKKTDYYEELKSALSIDNSYQKPQQSSENNFSKKKFDKTQNPTQHRKNLCLPKKGSLDGEKNKKKVEICATATTSNEPISKKQPECNKVQEIPLTSSEYRKIKINEILKEHAQKVSSFKFETGTENLIVTSLEEGSQQEEKQKNPKDELEIFKKEEIDFRKARNRWIRYRQAKQQEKRLKEKWKGCEITDSGNFQEVESIETIRNNENDDGQLIEGRTEEEYEKSNENEKREGAKKDERRTYTDRLLAKRNQLKDERKSETDKEGGEDGLRKKETSKDLAINKSKELSLLKELRYFSSEQFIKPKTTRSAELRDLVNQAVKDHKIFCIFDNHWYIVRPVREELLSRGWLEIIPDRRLIPRRRPPPPGPLSDREKPLIERNSNTIEAILAAKETFADELEVTVSRSSSFKTSIERQKFVGTTPNSAKKRSEESLKGVMSQFRIIPPTAEIKKNNLDIRLFASKCTKGDENEKEKDGDKKEKDKTGKTSKKSKENNTSQSKNNKSKGNRENLPSEPSSLGGNLQTMLDTIKDGNKTIMQALTEAPKLDSNQIDAQLEDASEMEASEENETQEEVKEVKEEEPKALYKENEAKVISKMLQAANAKIQFMWLSIKPAIHLKCFNYSPEIVNKYQKTSFCTKIGLWNHLNNIQWYAHEVHFPAKSPRMYNTGEADDLQAFFQDFQITACTGILKWLVDNFFDKGIKAVATKKGKVPLKAFEFAIKQCERFMRFKDNEDLGTGEEPRVLQEEWNTFLQWFYTITNDHGKVQETSSSQLMVVSSKAAETLRLMKKFLPDLDADGRLNIWIMKPYCASCGRGIFMTNNVYYIGQHSKYIVQKYIEKPLLIYNTKFDIRQWFMITKLTPLEIWMYKECYLRFCSQPFALRNLHESVHLSNNSVQRKYVNFRNSCLPDQNMWDSNTFQLYLKSIGQPNAWNEIIYPGMKDAIVSTMLSAQDTFDAPRKNWFEVYGADFMLSSNVLDGPWLIEINENPAMDPSTKVTSRLCPQMLRDVIKVVIDKKADKTASTGQWELVYRQNYSPSFATVDIDVKGRKISKAPTAMKLELCQHPSTSPIPEKRRNELLNKTEETVRKWSREMGTRKEDDPAKSKQGKQSGTSKKPRTFEMLLRECNEKLKEVHWVQCSNKTEEEEESKLLKEKKSHITPKSSSMSSRGLWLSQSTTLKRGSNSSDSRDIIKKTYFGCPEIESSTYVDLNLRNGNRTEDEEKVDKFKFNKFYKV